MDIKSAAIEALNSMRANKIRTSLTVLGMVIGIASVVIVFSAGEGISGLITSQIETFGTDIIETEIKVPSSKKGNASEAQSASAIVQGVQVTTLKEQDMKDINKLPNVLDSYGGIMSQEQVSYGNELKKAFLYGVSASFINIDKANIEYGRFFTSEEERSLSQVVVLGSKIKDKLFGDSEAIGKSIKLKKSKYRVIGVLKERGAVMTLDFDEFVYVPAKTLQKRVMGIDYYMYFIHKIENLEIADDTAEEIRMVLRENHDIDPPEGGREGWADTGKDDFRVVTMAEMMEMMDTVTAALTYLLIAIVAISLVVGGVGIMNIMYVIISERTNEIGLRKAVGAKYNDIMFQFLIESILITIIGGFVGTVLGVIVSALIALGANSSGLDWSFSIPVQAFITSVFFSLLFGVFFGVYPARKAAKLDPIEALRNE